MRLTIFTTVLLIQTFICCHSQNQVTFNKNSTVLILKVKPSVMAFGNLAEGKQSPYESLFNYSKSFELNKKRNEESDVRLTQIKSKAFDNTMPCYKPNTNSKMPVVKPDSITNYSLLIRKYK